MLQTAHCLPVADMTQSTVSRREHRRNSFDDSLTPRSSPIVASATFSNRLLHDLASSASSQLPSKPIPDAIPSWARESVRPSRASSIISTRTKTSITTMDDDTQDGFDVQVGNDAIYRLGLDGRIKYITSHRTSAFEETDSSTVASQHDRSRAQSEDLDPTTPTVVNENHTLTQSPIESTSVSRTPSFTPGRERISVQRRPDSSSSEPTDVGSCDTVTLPPTPESARLRRRGGLKLRLVTRTMSGRAVLGTSPLTPSSGSSAYNTASPNSEPVGSEQMYGPASPAYIGRTATGVFPSGTATFSRPHESFVASGDDTPAQVDCPRATEEGSPKFTHPFKTQQHEFTQEEQPTAQGRNERNTGDRSLSASEDDYPQHLLIPGSPPRIEEAAIGSQPPPPMDSENDVSIHYSRLVRSIDASHRRELQAKDQELLETREMMKALARQVLDLKTELLRSKNQIKTISNPGHIRQLAREDTVDARSFSFPPLNLTHIRTLKVALKRRAEKIKRDIDDEMGWTPRGSVTSPPLGTDEPLQEEWSRTVSDPSQRMKSPARPELDTQNSEDDYNDLLRLVERNSLETRISQSAIKSLEAHVGSLRESASFWTDRCEKLEQQRKHAMAVIQEEQATAVSMAKDEVERTWRARWEERSQQLTRRMQRIEREAQLTLESAVAERDRRAEERKRTIAELTRKLEMKEGDVAVLELRDLDRRGVLYSSGRVAPTVEDLRRSEVV